MILIDKVSLCGIFTFIYIIYTSLLNIYTEDDNDVVDGYMIFFLCIFIIIVYSCEVLVREST